MTMKSPIRVFPKSPQDVRHEFFKEGFMRWSWIGVVVMVVFAGCISIGNPTVADEDVISQITSGTTTKEDVRALLGKPNSIIRDSGKPFLDTGLPVPLRQLNYKIKDYEIWSYTHTNLERNPATAIPLIGPLLFLVESPSTTASAIISFDENEIVKYLYTHQVKSMATLEFW